MDIRDLGVQSYCFRAFKPNEQVVALVKQCGLAKIELCGVHVDFNDEASFDRVIETYRRGGVDVASIGAQRFANDEKVEARFCEFVKRAGGTVITADFVLEAVPACYRTAEKLAEQYDLKIAIHNHGGRHWLGSATMLRHVLANTSERIGLCLDTAWALDSHEDPLKLAEMFAKRLYAVHLKDFVFDRAGKPEDVVVGQGNLALGRFLGLLREIGFSGPLLLEYEGDVDNPVPALQACVAAVEKEMARG